MKNHEMNEKNQVKELSKEEMRQILGGGRCGVEDPVSQTCYEVRCPSVVADKFQDDDIPTA